MTKSSNVSRPSISELKEILAGEDGGITNNTLNIGAAMPVLIAIAEAALNLGPDLVYLVGPRSDALRDALAGIRR